MPDDDKNLSRDEKIKRITEELKEKNKEVIARRKREGFGIPEHEKTDYQKSLREIRNKEREKKRFEEYINRMSLESQGVAQMSHKDQLHFLIWIAIILLFPILGVFGIGFLLTYDLWMKNTGAVHYVRMTKSAVVKLSIGLTSCFVLLFAFGFSTIDNLVGPIEIPSDAGSGKSGFCATEARTFEERAFIREICR